MTSVGKLQVPVFDLQRRCMWSYCLRKLTNNSWIQALHMTEIRPKLYSTVECWLSQSVN